MQRAEERPGDRAKVLLCAIGLAVVCMIAAIDAATAATPIAQAQVATTAAPHFKYEIVSVKPSNPENSGKPGTGTLNAPDGYVAKNMPLFIIIDQAFGILHDEQLVGASKWISTEEFDVDAKMDPAVADAFQKLTQDERKVARQQMLQALLADRFKLQVHREPTELSVYNLVIAKGGLKMKQADPTDTYPDGLKRPDGSPARGVTNLRADANGISMTAQAVSMLSIVQHISREVRRIVVDKTGLTGNFDFKMQYMPDTFHAPPTGDASGSASSMMAADPGGTSIFTSVQEQLGLKLESVKAPIEVIVIDHVERPSGN
jgi:uncharacterized protein (TIGR03435 family)